jgi:hypothetical protein
VREVGAAAEGWHFCIPLPFSFSSYFVRKVRRRSRWQGAPRRRVVLRRHDEFHARIATGGFGAVHVDLHVGAEGEGVGLLGELAMAGGFVVWFSGGGGGFKVCFLA